MPIQAYPGKVIVEDLERGEQATKGGIVLRDDNGKSEGIRARWAKVYAIGPDVENIAVGNWILIQHGRWTRGIEYEDKTLYMVDWPSAVYACADTEEMPDWRFTGLTKVEDFSYNANQFRDDARNKIF